MTDAAELPKNSATAQTLITEMKTKRAALLEAIEAAATRRRASAALAGLGNASAQAELERAEVDEKQARAAVQRLDEAIRSLEQHRETVRRAEQDARAHADAERQEQAIDELLELDDRIDERCAEVRQLLQRRREMLAAGLQSAGNFGNGVGASRAVGNALLAFFSEEFWFLRGNCALKSSTGLPNMTARHLDDSSPDRSPAAPAHLRSRNAR